MPEDAELLRRYAAEKSESAFAELVRRHLNLVYSVALRQVAGDAHLAEDVAQQVFTALARKAGRLVDQPSLSGWLYRSTHFVASDIVRAERRRRAREQEAHAMNELSVPATVAIDWEKVRPTIDVAIAELNDRDRAAVSLRFFDGCSFAEVGRRLRLTENAARMRVERALDKLHGLLARRGVTSTAAALGSALANQAAIAAPVGLAASVTSTALGSVGGTSAWAFVQFMSTTKFAAGCAGLAIALAVGFTAREVRHAQQVEAALAAAARDTDATAVRVDEAQRHAGIAERALADWEPTLADARASQAAAQAKGAEAAARVRDPFEAGKEFLAAHPETLRVATEYSRINLTNEYQLLFESLGLTPSQIQQFVDLRLQIDGGLAWSTPRQAPAVRFNVGELSREQVEGQLRALLGDGGYQRYQEFDRTRAARSLVGQLAMGAYDTEAPLTPEQARRLSEVVARHSPTYREGRGVDLRTLEWDNAAREAAGFLSEAQLAAFGALRSRGLGPFRAAINQAVNQAMNEAKQAAGVPLNY